MNPQRQSTNPSSESAAHTYTPLTTMNAIINSAAAFISSQQLHHHHSAAVTTPSSPPSAAPSPQHHHNEHFNTYWIGPQAASRLDGVKTMPLPAMDHIFSQHSSITVVPGKLDEQRFKLAVSKTLVQYPHIGARLENVSAFDQSNHWQFSLRHISVPITFRTSNLTSLLSTPHIHPSLIDPLPYLSTPPQPPNLQTTPLAKWTITHLPNLNKSVIAFHACRALGDTTSLARVNLMVSDFYQGRSRATNGPVSYDGFFNATLVNKPGIDKPARLRQFELDQVISAGLADVVSAYTEKELIRQHNLETTITEPLAFTLEKDDIERLHRVVQDGLAEREGNEKMKLDISQTDALCAYLIRVFSEANGNPGGRAVFLASLPTNQPFPPSSNTTFPLITPTLPSTTNSPPSLTSLASLTHHTLTPNPLTSSLHTVYTLPAYTSLLSTFASHNPPLSPFISPPRPSSSSSIDEGHRWTGIGIDVTQVQPACLSALHSTTFGWSTPTSNETETYILPDVSSRGFARLVPTPLGGVRVEVRVEKGKNVREMIEQRVAKDREERFSRFIGEGTVSAQARL